MYGGLPTTNGNGGAEGKAGSSGYLHGLSMTSRRRSGSGSGSIGVGGVGGSGWKARIRHVATRRPTTLLLLLPFVAAFIFGLAIGRIGNNGQQSSFSIPRLFSNPETKRPPFYVPPSLFPPPPPARSQSGAGETFPAPLKPQKGQKVPNVIHYVYGLKVVEEGKEVDEFPYYAYLAVRSAIINIKPEKVYFHHQNIPRGPWFDLLRPHLELIKTHVPDSIMGNPLSHFAHKSDVIRLNALLASGGIYLDIDMFVLRPFTPLMYSPTTLGMEASPDSRRTPLDPEGLCNAVIISEPNSRFLETWRASYETFNEGVWADHSVVMPWEIARRYPDSIQVLSTRAFFWPLWSGEEIQHLHENDDYDFAATGQFAYHAWESLAMRYLSVLNPKDIRSKDTSFHRMVRPFIGNQDEAVFEKLQKEQQ